MQDNRTRKCCLGVSIALAKGILASTMKAQLLCKTQLFLKCIGLEARLDSLHGNNVALSSTETLIHNIKI